MAVKDYFDHNEMQQRLGALRTRFAELEGYPRPELSPEQIERERWQWESNAFAQQHPMYAAARAAAIYRAIVPLEPLGRKPLVPPSKATQDEKTILDWWRATPDANIGVPVGRANNLIAMHVEDLTAQVRLRGLTKAQSFAIPEGEEKGKTFTEYLGMNFARVQFAKQGQPFRQITDWGKQASKKMRALEVGNEPPEEHWFVWSYPPIQGGQDAHEFPRRRIATGVQLLGPGEVIPWGGSRLEGRLLLTGPSGPLPEIPTWLAAKIGKPRSRQVMQAAREAWDAALRAASGISDAELLRLIELREQAFAQAQADAKKANAALARVEQAEAQDEEQELPPVLPDEEEQPK